MVRCAIYTRVSTEHGLDQEFNSLDAQYDAASAYIKSLAHAGWTLIRSRYDDGGRAASAAGFCARTRPPGTEFLDAETGPQISPPKWVSAHRDKNPGNEWSEIPAETPYLAPCRKHAVCKDWMVVRAVRYEPVFASKIPVLRSEQRNLVED